MVDFPVAEMPASQIEAPAELRLIGELKGRDKKELSNDEGGKLRTDALRQEGLRVGAQTALAYRYGMIMDYLEAVEPKLNVAFNFAQFVRDGHLLIPAITEVRDQYTKENGLVHRVKAGYTVQEEAQVVSSVPTWRDYVYQRYEKPELPHEALFPRDDFETSEWKRSLLEGWNAGIYQADEMFKDRVNQLTKAVEGRHQYVTLESRAMFSPADLKVVNSQVTFQGRTMNVGEQIIGIGQLGNFTNSQTWAPIWTR
ncbi:type IV secretory system conjugative DNA transfer family protein [Pseudomonas sp. DSV-1]|uniref:type IV secretory system conjugative DNA transfer family protein n=1 Tax=Pseudomonas sp. DSV-1 TaxID=3112250 RepID=UPI002DBD6D53|nr:type IV secretory system conjugative DNA transfer family protein [Pseudomonas sp. DSV-1]MEC4242098.1 type IV secretory system conjugative DNA transfer family protein [Pseudomonas sp. DSV-1]